MYSVGVDGISFGQFKEKAQAADTLGDVALFLSGRDTIYVVPQDTEAEAEASTEV